MKANVKKISLVAICVLIGYVLGSFIGLPSTSGGFGAGDISKVSKYHTATVSPQANAFQERILNDSTERAKAAATLLVITSRMQEFSALVDVAARASEGISELSEQVETLKTVKKISENAVKSGNEAKAAFVDIVNREGKNAASVYEQAYKNLSLAYLMLDRQVKVAKEYVVAVDYYLKGKAVEQNKELALSRDLWANYCAGNAQLNHDSEENEYWQKKGVVMDSASFVEEFKKSGNPTIAEALRIDNVANLGFYDNVSFFNANTDNFSQNTDNFSQNTDNFSQNTDNFNFGVDNFNFGVDNFNFSVDNFNFGVDNFNFGVDNFNFKEN